MKKRLRKFLYYHPKKKAWMTISDSRAGGKSICTSRDITRGTEVSENPEIFGWRLVGELR